jgi:hypothetical protein
MAEKYYASYLLRLWRCEVADRPAWRASLESTRTGERQTFSLEELLAYLQSHFGSTETPSAGGTETGQDSAPGQLATWRHV